MTGRIYLIAAEGTQFVKIGYSENPIFRLAELQTGCPHFLRIVDTWQGDIEAERRIHNRLKSYRGMGEWFNIPSDDLTKVCASIELECKNIPATSVKIRRFCTEKAKDIVADSNSSAFERLKAKRKAIRDFNPDCMASFRMKSEASQLCSDYSVKLLLHSQNDLKWMEEGIDGYLEALGIKVITPQLTVNELNT